MLLQVGAQLLGVVLQRADARFEALPVTLPLRGRLLLEVIELVPGLRQLVWVERDGTPRGDIGQPQDRMWSPAISPNG